MLTAEPAALRGQYRRFQRLTAFGTTQEIESSRVESEAFHMAVYYFRRAIEHRNSRRIIEASPRLTASQRRGAAGRCPTDEASSGHRLHYRRNGLKRSRSAKHGVEEAPPPARHGRARRQRRRE